MIAARLVSSHVALRKWLSVGTGSRDSHTSLLSALAMGLLLALAGMLSVTSAYGQTSTFISTAGVSPYGVAVNIVTNKAYVANLGGTITVIDGATNRVLNELTPGVSGAHCSAVAIDPVMNLIYVTDGGAAVSGSPGVPYVTVIDGSNDSVIANVRVGTSPRGVAVNPVSHLIYVTNYSSNNVSVIDGSNKASIPDATILTAGVNPYAVAVNSVTNFVYVGNQGDNTITVIDGSRNSPQYNYTLSQSGSSPAAVAVNPITNKIYLANGQSRNVVVIQGATTTTPPNVIALLTAGTDPAALAVNPITNLIYVTNGGDTTATVVDGSYNTSTQLAGATGINSFALSLNVLTNKVYITNGNGAAVTVIDGNNPTAPKASFSVGSRPIGLAVNAATNKVYVANLDGGVSAIDAATNTSAPISVASTPAAVAVNPSTKQIYVASSQGGNTPGSVTVIDGLTGPSDTALSPTIPVGNNPIAVAINAATDTTYVLNQGSNSVSAIDGSNLAATPVTLPVGSNPTAIAVNPATADAYVANSGDGTITIINGTTVATPTPITVGGTPSAVAVDPAGNKVYVANTGSNNVTVIDGVTNGTTSVSVGSPSNAIAVDTAANNIYVANSGGSIVSVINGSNLTAAPVSVPVHTSPVAIAINPATRKIYVVSSDGTVAVIDGTNPTGTPTTVTVGSNPTAISINVSSNKIYVVNSGSGNVTIIDGATNSTRTIRAVNGSSGLYAVSVNPTTGRAYVASGTSSVIVISEADLEDAKLDTSIQVMPDSRNLSTVPALVTTNRQPSFTFTASSRFSPPPLPPPPLITNLYYQVDTRQGTWTAATALTANGSSATFTTTIGSPLAPGEYILYAFAQDDTPETTSSFDDGVRIGNIQTLYLVVVPTATTTTVTSDMPAGVPEGTNVTFTANVVDSSQNPVPSGTVQFSDGSTVLCTAIVSNGTATCMTNSLSAGPPHTIVATFIPDPSSDFGGSTNSLQQIVIGSPANITIVKGNNQDGTINAPFALPLVVLITDANNNPVPNVTVTFTEVPGPTGALGTLASGTTTAMHDGTANDSVTANHTDGTFSVISTGVGLPVGSNSVTFTLRNVIGTSTTALTANSQAANVTVMYGDTLTLQATVDPSGATGSVTFLNDIVAIPGSPVTVSTSGLAKLNTTALPVGGPYPITAAYTGDANYGGSRSNVVEVTVTKKTAPNGGPALTVTADNKQRNVGEANPPFTYTVTGTLVNGDTAATAITGTAQFATTAEASSPPGTYPITVSGLVSANYVIEFVPGTLTVTAIKSPVVIEVTPPSPPYGDPIFIEVKSGDSMNPHIPTGTIIVIIDGGPPMMLPLNANGQAMLPGNLPPGPHTIEVIYPGDTNFNPDTTTQTINIQKAPTTTTLVTSNPSVSVGEPVTFTAQVVPNTTGAPTGTVTFYADGVAIGTVTINASGVATLSVSTLPAGTHAITATYSGDANFLGSSASGLSQVITADFKVASSTGPQTIPPGAAANYNIIVSPVSSPFNDLVTMSASNLPPGATYTFTPAAVTPGASGANTTFTVTVPQQSSMASRTSRIGPAVLALLLLPLTLIKRYRYKPYRLLLWLLIGLTSFSAMTGCGEGGYFSLPQQTYVITVTGTSGSLIRSTTVSLTVE
ncbi:S-layer family protein [Edaphobacter aggregans]|uniref:beta strand repeat-containing protein n=1 Tax=Edaphobacter aggregans TaxID=570835 RepID=UPI00163B3A36|nr:Ig-like domain repeat protein [Edaphobacter aggregans]